jgi:hypothetical protein
MTLLIMVLGVAKSSTKASQKKGRSSSNVTSSQAASIATSRYNLGSTSGSSSSRHIHRFSSFVSRSTGRTTTKNITLNPTGILRQQDIEEKDYLTRTEAMTSTQLEELHAATIIYNDYDTLSRSPSPAININDILSGYAPLDLSHEGGELAELLAIEEDVLGPPAW